jgi:hypothetical protein
VERRSACLQPVSRDMARCGIRGESDRGASAAAGVRGLRERTARPLGPGEHGPEGDADA